MTIPVVFIHFGPCDYAALTTAHARRFDNDVWFLTDQANHAPERLDPPDGLPFDSVYVHMSTNHVAFEKQCFERWFILDAYLRRTEVPACLYLDTDVLLFANADREWDYYRQFDFTLTLGTSPHTSFIRAPALTAFCEFLLRTYRDRDANFQELVRIFEEMRAQNLNGGVSDMLLWKMFAAQSGLAVGEMSEIRDRTTWDHNLNVPDAGFVMKDGHKAIQLESVNGVAVPCALRYYETMNCHDPPCTVAEWVRFKSLHFQDGAKSLIKEFAL